MVRLVSWFLEWALSVWKSMIHYYNAHGSRRQGPEAAQLEKSASRWGLGTIHSDMLTWRFWCPADVSTPGHQQSGEQCPHFARPQFMGFAHEDSCSFLNKREVNSRGRFPRTHAGWETEGGGIKGQCEIVSLQVQRWKRRAADLVLALCWNSLEKWRNPLRLHMRVHAESVRGVGLHGK